MNYILKAKENPIILNESRRWQYRFADKFGINPSDVKNSAKLNGRDYNKLESKGLEYLKDQEKGNKIYSGKGKPTSGGKAYFKPTNFIIGGKRVNPPENTIIPDYTNIKTDNKNKRPSFGLINLERRVDSHIFRDDKENQKRIISELININSLPNGHPKKEMLKKISNEEIKNLIELMKRSDAINKNVPKEYKSDLKNN